MVGECDLFVQHCWKPNFCSNCFGDKDKHMVNPPLVNSKKTSPPLIDKKLRLESVVPAQEGLNLKTSCLDSRSEELVNGIHCVRLHGVLRADMPSLLCQDANPTGTFTRNVLRDDKYFGLSKQSDELKGDTGNQISLTIDEKGVSEWLRAGEKQKRSSWARTTSEPPNLEHKLVGRREKPFASSNSSRPNSGNQRAQLSSQSTSHVGKIEKETSTRDIQPFQGAHNIGRQDLGITPKSCGNLLCLKRNLTNGSSVSCQWVFASIKAKDSQSKVIEDNLEGDVRIHVANGPVSSFENSCYSPQGDMVIVRGKPDQETHTDRNKPPSNGHKNVDPTVDNTWRDFESSRKCLPLLNDAVACSSNVIEECNILGEFKDGSETVGTYANTNDLTLTEHRQVFELCRRSRNDSIDSTEEAFSPRIQSKFQGDYECMSSPDSFSTPSSNRSSNTSSLHGNYSPDSASLNSFGSARFNFGRCEGSKRCSQASSASQDSGGRQSWNKTRDSLDLSDGGNTSFARRFSSDNIYENTGSQSHEVFSRFIRENRIRAGNMDDEEPPPLPERQCPPTSGAPKSPEVELIMPYKVVDLEELQKSLDVDDMEPYYIHTGSDSSDNNSYNDCSDTVPQPETEMNTTENPKGDFRPALPPKRRTLSHSLSDSTCDSTDSGELMKKKPTPLPRRSVVLTDSSHSKLTESDLMNTNEDTTSPGRSSPPNGHLARQGSLPVGRVTRSRRRSTSPSRTARPRRTAPPPPPQTTSPNDRNPSTRPVSEMFPRSQNRSQLSPKTLKRSNTVSALQCPVNNKPVERTPDFQNSAQVSIPSSSSPSGSPLPQTCQTSLLEEDEKPVATKEDATKSGFSKTGAFFSKNNVFKKALISLKKPVTKKQAKKELVIGRPTDFASLYQPRITAARNDRGRKTVSFLDTERHEESLNSDPKMENDDRGDEEVYHNFPISHTNDNPDKLLSPKKPPRRFTSPDVTHHNGYLQPSTSQWTKDQEDELSQNKRPELGPLPDPPEELSSPEAKDPPKTFTNLTEQNGEKPASDEPPKPVVKTKPEVPRRPENLKRKLQKQPAVQVSEKPEVQSKDRALEKKSHQTAHESVECRDNQDYMTLRGISRRSRSCEILDVDDSRDSYLTNMHVTVLKDILFRWRNMLRKPKISLSGACWDDFEIVEAGSWPKVSEAHGNVLQPVQLKKSSRNLDSDKCGSQFLAKIKSQTQANNTSKSCYDQDYSVCTSVESHENVARVLAYFRGDIRPSLLGQKNGACQVHTTISITDQVPVLTGDEFVAKSVEFHGRDPYSYERTVCLLMLQCLKGLDHLHNAGFTHGNLTLSNIFLIKHTNDLQVILANLGKSQPLPKERRGSSLKPKAEDTTIPTGMRNDLTAASDVISAMLHLKSKYSDQNDNVVDISECRTSPSFDFLRKASDRLRDGTTTISRTVGLLQALLWGPFKMGENGVVLSENRMKQWLDRERGEFIARLAMDEALSRTVSSHSRERFSMEDLLLCEYLSVATPRSLIKTEKCWFFEKKLYGVLNKR